MEALPQQEPLLLAVEAEGDADFILQAFLLVPLIRLRLEQPEQVVLLQLPVMPEQEEALL